MLASDIREMTEGDIQTRINELEEERFRLKFRGATETLEQPLRLRLIRKDVARLKTVLRERELGAATTTPDAAQSTQTSTGKKSTAKKATAKKRAAKKSTATKSTAKKSSAKKSTAKKSAPKARTSSARKTARSAAPKARKQER